MSQATRSDCQNFKPDTQPEPAGATNDDHLIIITSTGINFAVAK
jgi:hypothetical protein